LKGRDGTFPYRPRSELFKAFPDMQALSKAANDVMEGAEETLSEREFAGCDTSWARAHLYEAEWRINYTNDYKAACDAVDRLKTALVCADPPDGLTQDCGGSFAPGTDVFFLKLDRSTDQLLARRWPWRLQPTFLDPINDPGRMVTYLQDLCWSDVVRCGRDNRKELNLAVSVIARLVLRGGQAGYLSGPGFVPVFERFVRDWQDPATGFFGATYIIESQGNEIRTTDLSLTFHMVRYAPHLVRWWPRLIDTLLAMKKQQYPQGWLENSKMTDHNNYDVVELFFRGWPHMRSDQRQQAADEVAKMLNWCLNSSVRDTGEIINPDKGDMVMDSYYFAAAFLHTIGYFDTSKRFWADKGQLPADTEPLRKAMIAQLKRFNSDLTVVDDTLEHLGAGRRPWSNAIL
jgi:hypothetical protein